MNTFSAKEEMESGNHPQKLSLLSFLPFNTITEESRKIMKIEIISATIILTIAAYIDWKEHRVPNWLTFAAWIGGMVYHTIVGGFDGLTMSLIGTVVGLATLIIPYALNGMGAGDVKLMASVGAWVGAAATLHAFLWIALIGGLMGILLIIRSGQASKRLRTVGRAGVNLVTGNNLEMGNPDDTPEKILLPYGVPIAFGFYAFFLFGGLV
ncbi:MAG: prepilin peptidase [Candidatus Omnitrophota bacterium]|jgi:prepilin peptidase CpaA|nr:MAG: prepilin peptidase [Candidatus Omnitrophota bacterium]